MEYVIRLTYGRVLFLLFFFILLTVKISSGAINENITPPPRDGRKPVISNGIVWFLDHIAFHCRKPFVATYPGGGIIRDRRALMTVNNPHIINGNIEIAPSGCLYIEPGSELRFGPGFGILVNGTLISRGSDEPGGRILMTKNVGGDAGVPSGDWQDDARLVDGNTTQDGRLDLFYANKWRGICTNYKNYTEVDANVTCRHLGFLKGNFTYHSFSRNYTEYMLYEKPNCTGHESNLLQCRGASAIVTGAHVCDGQQLIGFECEGLKSGLALDHWRGLEFYNSTLHELWIETNVYVNQSSSWIEYTDILYAGLDTFHGKGFGVNYQRAAVSASPFVPLMNNVTIKYCAYDALNLTEIEGSIHIANSTILKNRGYGMFIQTTVGRVLVNMTNITDNWGDGIKMYMTNLTLASHEFPKRFPFGESFCRTNNMNVQIFPVLQAQDVIGINGEKPLGSSCDREFTTLQNKKVTIHFLRMIRDPEATAQIEIRDGGSTGKLIGVYEVSNGSFPQSVVTMTRTAHIRLKWNIPRSWRCSTFKPCIRMMLELGTTEEIDEDFRLIYSEVSNNIGYGVSIQDMRSKVFFNTSQICDNQYGAGIRVYQGAGEVTVNNTLIERNQGSGINITYSGGFQLVNNSKLIGNKGYGMITEYLQLNRTRIEAEQILEVVRTQFQFNEWRGLRVGNYCRGGHAQINESYFAYNLDEAIEYLSCNISTTKSTNFTISFTTFHANHRHGVLIRPLVNTVGIMTNNTFTNHSMGALLIDNGYDLLISRWYRQFQVDYNFFENTFQDNYGRYAFSARLTEGSPFQNMYVKFNRFVNNDIKDSFMYLNPRNRANAVIVISSGNIMLLRNHIQNANSVRQIATHLIDPSVTIDATQNWWGFEVLTGKDQEPIHEAIFDQDDRYNLAQVQYYPVLKTERLYNDILSNNVPRYNWEFHRGNKIGGILELSNFETQSGSVYHVDRDIYIIPGKELKLTRSTVLEFDNSVGMVIHGCMNADGNNKANTIQFRLRENPDELPIENRTAPVRLVDGVDEFEGRLEIEIDNEWGTVCDEGWTEQNAILVCQQLGLIYSSSVVSQRQLADGSTPIFISWVDCEAVDTDITKCRAVRGTESKCIHAKDVFLRCQSPTWAGITFPATPRNGQTCNTVLNHISIHRAGLLDSDTTLFTPALRIDYNYYAVSHINVTDSLSDGIHIKFNHPYSENRIEYANVINNAGNGIVLRSSRMDLLYSTVTNSGKAGFLHDPFFSEYDSLIVRNSIHSNRQTQLTETPTKQIGDRAMNFLVTKPGMATEDHTYWCELSVSNTFRVTLQLLDYSPLTDVEEVVIYDSSRAAVQPGVTRHWRIEEDLIDFPIVSVSRYLTIMYHVRGVRSGRLTFAAISETFHPKEPVLKTYLRNCTFDHNDQGIVTKHYNNPSNQRMELYHRHKLETFWFDRVNVYHSRREAMHVPSVTKYHDDYVPTWEEMSIPQRVATIEYRIQQCKFYDNAIGILGEHNHVDFANNVWHWYVTQIEIQRTGEGGFEIELPRVNDEENVRKKHSVLFNQSLVIDNKKFAFTIAGFYADVNIMNNEFERNLCRLGLMLISGMEKSMQISMNRFASNVGRYVINLDIISHSEYSDTVTGILFKNNVMNNRRNPADIPPGSQFSPKTYGVAFRGLQVMSAKRNLFHNPDLGYEFVAATTALSLGTTLDVKENWWGKTDIHSIETRIFDFDDWNNYAIASYHPYLTKADFEGDLSEGEKVERPVDPSRLGGRVFRSLILPFQREPYIVYADLTIMPGAKLILEQGTELQFRPNVGILVLGQLIARGLVYNRIKMRPLQPSRTQRSVDEDELPLIAKDPALRTKRSELNNGANNIRLTGRGTLFENAGFLELYNISSKSWNLMCDSQFNEKTAEVVCRELGMETINVRVRFSHLYDHYIHGGPSYFRKEFWMYTYYCSGVETSLDQCMKRYNYNLFPCIYAANYTFVTCGKRNLDGAEYWGNIRFSMDNYQEEQKDIYEQRVDSVMEYVDIEGAGMLHGEKVGAIQTTYVTPIFRNINITQCASNGYDIIAPRDVLEIHYQNVSGNLGYGINVLVLNGESSNRESSFQPLGLSTIPYYVYGLVEICRMEKEISLDNRMLLYYKYSEKSVDCVKIIRSSLRHKQVGIRFLQLNLFKEDFSRNVIEIFNGNEIRHSNLLKEIFSNSSRREVLQQYSSTADILTVHIHASMSHESYGFVAEVVTLPPDDLTYPNSNHFHKITNTVLQGNEDGGIQYKNVGEINPSVYIQQCYIENNGVAILNLTSPPSVDISLQGTLIFDFSHNYVGRNKGGMYLSAFTKTIATALRGNITNNLFAYGTHGEALNISGHYYERILIYQNYFYNYTSGDYRDIIHIKNVVVNFTYNAVTKNVGHYILAAYNSPFAQARQEYVRNGFNENNSTALYQSTIKVGSGRPLFMHNYIFNSLNDFELEADDNIHNFTSKINATQNWWGSDRYGFINGKIWDYTDDKKLSQVQFEMPKLDNRSVIEGKCSPGWKLDTGRCYRYIGGAMPYQEAERFCRDNNAFLAESNNRQEFLYYLLRLMMNTYSPTRRVWVAGNTKPGWCTAIELNYMVIEQDCQRILHPFICETDPHVTLPSGLESSILAMAIGIGVGVGGTILIVVLIITILWLIKSRRREKERFERTASMRSSLRSLRTKSQETILSGAASRRRIHELDDYSQTSAKTSSRNGSVVTGSVGSMRSARMLKEINGSVDSLHDSIPSQRQFGAVTGSVEHLQRDRHRFNYAPPEMQKRVRAGQNNRAYHEEENDDDDDDAGFASDTFDDDFDDDAEDEVKVPPQDATKVAYSNRNFGRPGQPPRVQNGILQNVGSPQVAQIYDDVPDENDDDDEDDDDSDEDEKSDGIRKSLSSFNQPESPTTPIKENIFLPRQVNLPPPPPDPLPPTSDSYYANVPGYQKPPVDRVNKPNYPIPAKRSRTPDFHNESRSSSQMQDFRESPKPNPRTLSYKNSQSRHFHSMENVLECPPYSESKENLQAVSKAFHSMQNVSPPPYYPSYENLHSQAVHSSRERLIAPSQQVQPGPYPPGSHQPGPPYPPGSHQPGPPRPGTYQSGPPPVSVRPQPPPSYRSAERENVLHLTVNPDSVETEI